MPPGYEYFANKWKSFLEMSETARKLGGFAALIQVFDQNLRP